jgi:DNA-binding NarL/FixJ family response regulator
MISVLIVDDHPIFRAGVVATLSAEPDFEIAGNVSSASEALEVLSEASPDVVLTDIRLKGDINGVELVRRIRASHTEVRVVVLTNYSNEPYIRAMMELGVEGYMLKDTPPREVIESIRMVKAGRTVFSTQVSRKVVQGYLGQSTNGGTALSDRLTDKEAEVLQLLVDGASNPEIAERLHVSLATVQFHLTSVYSKLGVKNRAEAIVHAAREGLVVIDE